MNDNDKLDSHDSRSSSEDEKDRHHGSSSSRISISDLERKLKHRERKYQRLKSDYHKLRKHFHLSEKYNVELKNQVDELNTKIVEDRRRRFENVLNKGVQTEIELALPAEVKEKLDKDWSAATEVKQMSLADCLREAAEQAAEDIDYEFDETMGLYYHKPSGYYYDSNQSLYYDPNTGIYFYYDTEKQSYEYHSQVDLSQCQTEQHAELRNAVNRTNDDRKDMDSRPVRPDGDRNNTKRKKRLEEQKREDKKRKERRKERRLRDKKRRLKEKLKMIEENGDIEMEEGECSDLGPSESSSSEEDYDESSKKWPPAVRAMVSESSVLELELGSLILIPYTGATVGSDSTCAVFLNSRLVCKLHAVFSYDKRAKSYVLKDLGSVNGTFINDTRLSEAEVESEVHDLRHGDTVRFGDITVILHIHPKSNETCDGCEPGQVKATLANMQIQAVQEAEAKYVSKEDREAARRKELKSLKKRFGLETEDYKEGEIDTGDYKDRAQVRRITKGSDNPYAKTEVASVEKAIPKANKGFKMMEKMGWKSGQTLGKTGEDGLEEPIKVELRAQKAGLGSNMPVMAGPSKSSIEKSNILAITQQRYKQIESEDNK